ncbi:MAG TPA: hypothetical protein VF594_04690 [Rubricoccaceae bacterium]|jgi:hypothetical protein
MLFRFPALALALLVVFAGCDSNSSTSALRDLDGTYTVAQLVFDPGAASLADADVGARLDNQTSFDIFSGNSTVLFTIGRDGSRSLATLDATATRGRATFTARAGSEDELAELLLPRTFTLTFDPSSSRTLTGEINLTGVNLEAFDPAQYSGLRSVSGTLRIRLDRSVD